MTAPGNHEASCSENSKESCYQTTDHFLAYINRFPLPVSTYGGKTPMWYSFNRGQVSWIIISTETDYPKAFFPNAKFGNQIQWLHTTLKAAVAARKTRPWIFVVGHRPVYCADKGFIKCDKTHSHCWPEGEARTVQEAFGGILDQYNVDVYFSGHVHSASRNLPVKNNGTSIAQSYTNPGTTVHLTLGSAGNEEGIQGAYDTKSPWYAWSYNGFGFALVDLVEDDAAQQHVFNYKFIESGTGKTLDTFKLTKPY